MTHDRGDCRLWVMDKIMCHLAAIRAEEGISQARLAELAGVHQNTVGLIERGQMVPSLTIARRIAAAVGRSIEEIWPVGIKDEVA